MKSKNCDNCYRKSKDIKSFCGDCKIKYKKKKYSYWIPICYNTEPRLTCGGRALNLNKFSDESEGEPFCETFCDSNMNMIKKELKEKIKELNLIQF